jgi:hypothetical protein
VHPDVTQSPPHTTKTKTDAAEHPMVFDRVGFLANGPPGAAGLPFI